MKIITVCLFICVSIATVYSSAIPMWEYLTKDEKMGYLYNMFANQVEEFCNFSSMEDCNKELLRHGLKNLHGMPEDHLDTMDPYQRGANTLIWESMMEGHEMMKKNKKSTTTPSPRRDSYDYYSESNYLGSASSNYETILNLNHRPINKGFTTNPTKQTLQQQQQNKPNILPTKLSYGPMVVRVHPDGRPVQEDKILPVDDDIHHYMMMKTKVPSMSQFEGRAKPSLNGPYTFYIRPSSRQ